MGQVHVHFGVDGGTPFTDTLVSSESSSSSGSGATLNSSIERIHSDTKRLLIGPVFRLDLSNDFGIEFDALYQRINEDATSSTIMPGYSYFSFTATAANRWQFPLLVQYSWKLPNNRTALFLESGLSISRITNGQNVSTTLSTSEPNSETSTTSGSGTTSAGVVAGAGMDLPLLHGHVRTGVRYTHWFAQTTTGTAFGEVIAVSGLLSAIVPASYSPSALQLRNDEASFLLGFTF